MNRCQSAAGPLLAAILALTAAARLGGPSRAAAASSHRPLNVQPKPIAGDPTVKYDYDIVYVRAPRLIKGPDGKEHASAWAEIGHPYNVSPGYDLMLLHPDGTEERLVEGGKGSVADPYVSFDGASVYYAYFHHPAADSGADIYKLHVKSRKLVRLTHQTWTPNTGAADWSKFHLGGVYNLGPCPLPGGRVAFVSNRDAVKTPKGYPQQALQLFVMDDDGANVEKIGHLNVGCALHPVILKDGRIIFSSLESQGDRNDILWGIWSIHPDGTNWAPVFSAFSTQHGAPNAVHFQAQLSDGSIVIEEYYNQNTQGFGTYFKMPPRPPRGVPAFLPAGGDPRFPFRPYGLEPFTPFTHGNDSPAPLSDPNDDKSRRVGKVQHPCGAPDNHLLTVWAPGAAPSANRGPVTELDELPVDAGIYLIKGGEPVREPGDMLLIKNDPKYNEQWPRPLVPYKRIYRIDEPARLPSLENDGKVSRHLPEGTPFGLVGTSSLYKRESFPLGLVPRGSVTATGNPYGAFSLDPWLGMNWSEQGADAGLYTNDDIHAIRILALEPASLAVAAGFYNGAHERMRILGEIPVRHFPPPRPSPTQGGGSLLLPPPWVGEGGGGGQPLDSDGNPDTSFLAKIPADVAFTFQTLDKDGMVLNMAQTWHQVRPGEIRTNCGGCHAHSQRPTLFQATAAAKADYPLFDLTSQTPLLTTKQADQSGRKWDKDDTTGLRFEKAVKNVEYYRDIRPIFKKSCVACHGRKLAKPAANLVLDDDKPTSEANDVFLALSGPVPATYRQLVLAPRTKDSRDSYVWGMQARRSLLTWKVFGRRTDGLPKKPLPGQEARHQEVLKHGDFKGSIMPPPAAVAGTYRGPEGKKIKVAPLTDEDRRTLVRWIDLGCPLDRDYDPARPARRGRGWLLDDQRPTLTLTYPRAGATELTRILVGMYDYGSGLDLDSFRVTADFDLDGAAAGDNLASKFKALSGNRWELMLKKPIAAPPGGRLTVAVKDSQGNWSRVERTFGPRRERSQRRSAGNRSATADDKPQAVLDRGSKGGSMGAYRDLGCSGRRGR
jgi:hypothetical protein